MKFFLFLSALGAQLNYASANPAFDTVGLMDPDPQPKFVENVPNALAPSFTISLQNPGLLKMGAYKIDNHETGLLDSNQKRLKTPVFGYGTSKKTASWPGPTLMAYSYRNSQVLWANELVNETGQPVSFPFTSLDGKSVVDTSLYWAYSIPGYENLTIEKDGVPIVTHVHGGHSKVDVDGNPEHHYTADFAITGPDFKFRNYLYKNDQPAGTLWYHDHTIGITRLTTYAGLAGFYILRDQLDNGATGNTLKLPAGEFEKAYAIQDRMFKENGELFVPAFKGDPYYDDFITDQGVNWDPLLPTTMAEFFGDFMLVNGKIWPKDIVKPRRYRLRLLNGCDSRFIVIKLLAVAAGETSTAGGVQVAYTIVGTDQGLLDTPVSGQTSTMIETGARLDIVVDFSGYQGMRIILANDGGDVPFNGDIPGPKVFEYTDMIMAFDVDTGSYVPTPIPSWNFAPEVLTVNEVRRVGLFEGRDEFGRLQPLLGGVKVPNIVETFGWPEAVTEKPKLNKVEEWDIYNFSGDAHPIHLHMVHFQVIGRYDIKYDTSADADGFCNVPVDGVCLEFKYGPGIGVRAKFPSSGPAYDTNSPVDAGAVYSAVNQGPKDVVTSLPGQVTKIRAKFDQRGKYAWHCHILSHEDHEMMRAYEVVK